MSVGNEELYRVVVGLRMRKASLHKDHAVAGLAFLGRMAAP